jgi:predicted esterase
VQGGGFGRDIASIDRLLHWAFDRYRVDRGRLAIGGFSDGASYCLSVGIANGDLFSHVLAFSPGQLPRVDSRGRPEIFVSHGTGDEVLLIDACSRRIVPALRRFGYTVDYREFAGGHEVPPTMVRAAVEKLAG